MKKLFSVLLTVVLLISVVPMGAFSFDASAATEYTSDYYTNECSDVQIVHEHTYDDNYDHGATCTECGYNEILKYISYQIDGTYVTITDCDTSIFGDFVIPSTIEGYPVTRIESGDPTRSGAFQGCSQLTGIVIPDSVELILFGAFYGCTGLTTVVIPKNASVWGSAFYGCTSLTNITIPSASYNAFGNCTGLTNVKINNGCKEILASAFSDCTSLTSITIPDSVTTIGSSAFANCNNLTDVWYKGSEFDKANIDIASGGNAYLEYATWHYNTCDDDEHIYSSECDIQCNNCDWTRESTAEHTYDNVCDTECNDCDETRYVAGHSYINNCDTICDICGEIRTITHIYSNVCDTECNVCGEIRMVPDHIYSNDKDIDCNVCGAIREVYKLGDINGDDTINNKDLGVLMQYLNDWEVEISVDAADVNGDASVNNKDYGLLMQYLNGWDVELK